MPTNKATLWLSKSIYVEMLELAQARYPLETGGMLLGYEVEDSTAVVTKLIGPGPNAKHGRFRFTPDGVYQQSELEKHFWTTDGRETYLGDWHTHPKSDSTPSVMDKRTLAHIAKEPRSGTKHPVMAILAGGSGSWSLGAVRFLSASRRLLWTDYRTEPLIPAYF